MRSIQYDGSEAAVIRIAALVGVVRADAQSITISTPDGAKQVFSGEFILVDGQGNIHIKKNRGYSPGFSLPYNQFFGSRQGGYPPAELRPLRQSVMVSLGVHRFQRPVVGSQPGRQL